jgi:glutamate formiminotransferase
MMIGGRPPSWLYRQLPKMPVVFPHAESWAIAANVYISEGRDAALLDEMRRVAGPSCVHVFSDAAYNRTGFTLASRRQEELHHAMDRLASLAFARIDLRSHEATHPRLGVVDHVSVHPLLPTVASAADGDAAQNAARALALHIGESLSQRLPVYLYGGATASAATLDAVRRSLGYFRCSAASAPQPPPPPPDLGPLVPNPCEGVVLVGSLPWVVNYNLALDWADGPDKLQQSPGAQATIRSAELLVRARRVAAQISQRRGGPVGCQSLALEHAEGSVEVACNLLTPSAPPVAEVHRLVERLAHAEGLRVIGHYCTGLTPEEILSAIMR